MTDSFERIRTSLNENLFVEAGAGTGKTQALVDRLVALVRAGHPITEIVAVTFTEKAAAELKERTRSGLERVRAEGDPGGHFAAALNALDAAPISTIHAFAAGLVRAFAAHGGVDPDCKVINDVPATRRFQQRWRDHLERAGEDADSREAVARCLRLGMLPADIETLAFELWQRPDHAALALEVEPPGRVRWPDFAALRDEIVNFGIDQRADDDRLAISLRALRDLLDLLGSINDPEREAVLAPVAGKSWGKLGNQKAWGREIGTVRARGAEIECLLVDLQADLRDDALRGLLPLVAGFVVKDREARCREGALTFDDLISIARDLVTKNEEVRQQVRERYHAFLIDEFQDTDPWQFEIARAFATGSDGMFEPGRLFLVGDPKQSIYRFRNADMAIYSAGREALAGAAGHVELASSRRATPAIVAWVNNVFARMFPAGGDSSVAPEYAALTAVRESGGDDAGPHVAIIGEVVDEKAARVRLQESLAVAAACREVVETGWKVFERDTGHSRPARFGDIAILIPARTVLPDIERALEGAAIPYRVESGSLVFQTQEVRDLINILGAIDDPGDAVAIVGALRSAAFACSDADLARHKLARGTFNYEARSHPPGPVADALGRLRRFHETRHETSLATLVQSVLAETGIVASAILDNAGRDAFRRARFVVEQARAFVADQPQPLRAFVDWLEERGSRPLVDHEGSMLDSDEDAVRILTVHGAKGLEFPVVLMAGFGSNPRNVASPTYAIDSQDRTLAVCVGPVARQFRTGGVEGVIERERRHAEAESVRLLYVAATRARDHLVVSLFRSAKGNRSSAQRLEEAGARERAVTLVPRPGTAETSRPQFEGLTVDLPGETGGVTPEEARAGLVAAARRQRVTSATALAAKEGREDDTEPWARGRGSTRLGRAVHAVVQSVPLNATDADIAAFARAQAVAEAIPGREAEVARLAARALASSAMSRARAARRTLREAPFAVDFDGTLVEGFVDLLVDTGDGLEIIDWKTDGIAAHEVDGRLEHYRLQAGLYVLGLERATGLKVRRVTYVFLSPGVEREPGDPEALAREAYTRLTAGSQV